MHPQDDDPVVLPKDGGQRALRWMLGFGGWMGVSVGALCWYFTGLRDSDNLFLSSAPALFFVGGVAAIAIHRRWRKPGEDDF